MKELTNSRDKYIDGMRGLACAVIVLHHYAIWQIPEANNGIANCINDMLLFMKMWGGYANAFFFFFSGYLLALKHKQFDNSSISTFLCKRIKGLWLPLVLNAIVMFIMNKYTLMHKIRNILLIHACFFNDGTTPETAWRYEVVGATWFITPLVICYFLFWIIVKNIKEENRWIAFFLLGLTGAIAYQMGWSFPLVNSLTAYGLLAFFAGSFFAFIWNRNKVKVRAVPICLLATALILVALYEMVKGIQIDILQSLAVIVLPCLLILGEKGVLLKRIVSNSLFVCLGEISMLIWLFHISVRGLLSKLFMAFNVSVGTYTFLISYIVVLIIVVYTYKRFDKQIRSLLRKVFLIQ